MSTFRDVVDVCCVIMICLGTAFAFAILMGLGDKPKASCRQECASRVLSSGDPEAAFKLCLREACGE